MRCSQEMCADKFGRKNIFPVNRPDATVIYVRRADGSLGQKYRSEGFSLTETIE